MDFLKNSLNKPGQSAASNQQAQQSGGGGFMDSLNNMGGGGQAGERNEGTPFLIVLVQVIG